MSFAIKLTRPEKLMCVLFLFTLPLINPWVRGDGVGYYAYARSILIQHNLDFRSDWEHANQSFRMAKLDDEGQVKPQEYTRTAHVNNHFAMGSALLWMPFLIVAHLGVVLYDLAGGHVPADGFSPPYFTAMAVGSATCAFLGLLMAFRIARNYFGESWAFLATLGIWFASPLPVYMYFNPSYSHAASIFSVSLFIFYWDRTRENRSGWQWIGLGLCGGLMIDVYYPNAIFMLCPLIESLAIYWSSLREKPWNRFAFWRLFGFDVEFCAGVAIGFLPSMVVHKILFGSILSVGDYQDQPWNWGAPWRWNVLFSSDHGLLTWTPILCLAIIGLLMWTRADRRIAACLLACALAYYYLIASYPLWDGLSSFGSRFFLSVTPIFVFGLAAFFSGCAVAWNAPRAMVISARTLVSLLIAWNLLFMFQWGTHMIPVRGQISFSDMARAQFTTAPVQMKNTLLKYLTHRKAMMNQIENIDIQQIREQQRQERLEHPNVP
jgi:hypothetical protein